MSDLVVHDLTTGPRNDNLVQAVITFLEREEALNSIMLDGILAWHAKGDPKLFVAALTIGDRVYAVASIWGGFRLILSQVVGDLDTICHALSDHLVTSGIAVPGVMAARPAATAFADAWTRRSATSIVPGMTMRMLSCNTILLQPTVPGSARIATDRDWDWMGTWIGQFGTEADSVTPRSVESYVASIRRRLSEPAGLMVWVREDGAPVSLAAFKAPTRNGWRIGPVFTPDEYRRHGYGQAVTAAVTRHLIERGATIVCLYADAANPTSNHIYEAIGFQWTADIANLDFRSPDQ